MTKRKIQTMISSAAHVAEREMAAHATRGHHAAGLASEGYAGGYRDALQDVQLLLNGVMPERRDYWRSGNV